VVEEFGEYLEELVKDYLTIVEGYDLVDIEVPRSPKHSTKHKTISETASRSDIDVAAVKGKVMVIVSCRERPGGAENWKKVAEQLKRARIAKDFQNLEVHYAVAYANYSKEVVENDIREFFKVRGVRVLFLEEMAEEVLMRSEG
jgi:hypothetical protein